VNVLGIDIGGSSIKFSRCMANARDGFTPIQQVATRQPATPESLANQVEAIVAGQKPDAIGIAFPAVVRKGAVHSCAHIDPSWLGVNGEVVFSQHTGSPVTLLNDADAALLAEREWGICNGVSGSVLMLTLGTGIGSALMVDGRIWWNSELGHLYLPRGLEAEVWAAASVRTEANLDWSEWAERLNEVLDELTRLFNPDLIVLGGGISADFHCFGNELKGTTPVKPSELGNKAGYMGAALAAMKAQRD